MLHARGMLLKKKGMQLPGFGHWLQIQFKGRACTGTGRPSWTKFPILAKDSEVQNGPVQNGPGPDHLQLMALQWNHITVHMHAEVMLKSCWSPDFGIFWMLKLFSSPFLAHHKALPILPLTWDKVHIPDVQEGCHQEKGRAPNHVLFHVQSAAALHQWWGATCSCHFGGKWYSCTSSFRLILRFLVNAAWGMTEWPISDLHGFGVSTCGQMDLSEGQPKIDCFIIISYSSYCFGPFKRYIISRSVYDMRPGVAPGNDRRPRCASAASAGNSWALRATFFILVKMTWLN